MAVDAVSLEAIQNMNQSYYEQRVVEKGSDKDRANGTRLDALREAALGAGARGGLVFQTRIINKALDQVKRNLDTVYDFAPMMIHGRVLPPVLTETREVYSQGDGANLRLAGRSYKVEAQAKFTSRPPQWRDYLYMEYGSDPMPSRVLMPANPEEQEVWKRIVAEGWKQGIEQATVIFTTNLSRLNRDYTGMARYHVLALRRMVTMPVVAEQNMPINTSGDTMSVDETLLRITALPEFNADMRDWTPLSSEVDQLQRPGKEAPQAPYRGDGGAR